MRAPPARRATSLDAEPVGQPGRVAGRDHGPDAWRLRMISGSPSRCATYPAPSRCGTQDVTTFSEGGSLVTLRQATDCLSTVPHRMVSEAARRSLTGDISDQVEVVVVVEHDHACALGDCRDQAIRDRGCAVSSTLGKHGTFLGDRRRAYSTAIVAIGGCDPHQPALDPGCPPLGVALAPRQTSADFSISQPGSSSATITTRHRA